MQQDVNSKTALDAYASAFEHSITWEDDIWRADPVDVQEVHAKARRKFSDLLDALTAENAGPVQARILLFHGQSGAGKTHLMRALRTEAHRQGRAYFGYAQMTPDVANYADYFLRRLIHSLEKPYDPDDGGESALRRLADHLVADAAVLAPADLEELREASLDDRRWPRSSCAWPTRSSPARSSLARNSTSTSCARCSTCSAAIRASTSASGNICTGAR